MLSEGGFGYAGRYSRTRLGADQHDITRENADDYFVVGEPEECAAPIEERLEAGVTKFQCWFVDFPDLSGMELFADEVMPEFR